MTGAGASLRMIRLYRLKLPQEPLFRERVAWLRGLAMAAGQQLLERLWSEQWLDTLADRHNKNKKAYKVIGEGQVSLTLKNKGESEVRVYLPSRIRRCIAEQVGRILRSQVKRRECFYDTLRVCLTTGVEGNLDRLVRIVAITLARYHGKYYRRALSVRPYAF